MPIPDKEKLFATLEGLGEQEVRVKLAQGVFGHWKLKLIDLWLLQKEKERQSTVYAKAFRLLQFIYNKTLGREEPVFVINEIGFIKEIGLSEDDAKAAWCYLRDKHLIETFGIPYTARINAHGIDAIESARLHPNEQAENFPSVTYNSITIQSMVGSAIQQGGAHATMTQIVSYSREDLDDLCRLVDVFENHFDDLALDAAVKRKAMVQIATIKAQLEDDPDPVILKQAGRTLRNVTEGAIGSLIATAAQPAVWAWAAPIIEKLFGGS